MCTRAPVSFARSAAFSIAARAVSDPSTPTTIALYMSSPWSSCPYRSRSSSPRAMVQASPAGFGNLSVVEQISEIAPRDLAELGEWDLGHEDDARWDLVRGKARAHVRAQLVLIDIAARNDDRPNVLAEIGIGVTGDGGIRHSGVRAQGFLYLRRIDLLAAAVDHVGHPADRVEVTVGVAPDEIAASDPTRRRGVRRARPELTDLTVGNVLAGRRVDDTHLDAGHRLPDRPLLRGSLVT